VEVGVVGLVVEEAVEVWGRMEVRWGLMEGAEMRG
jgi:hypothetical protein